MADGFVLGPGEGTRVSPTMTLKVGDENSTAWSMFEVMNIGPGFDVGAHLHRNAEELFYVLEGQLDLLAFEPRVRTPGSRQRWQSHTGATVARGGPGSMMYVPRGFPHAFANPGPGPARMVFLVSPSGHEHYQKELAELAASAAGPLEAATPSCAPAMTSSSSPRPYSAGRRRRCVCSGWSTVPVMGAVATGAPDRCELAALGFWRRHQTRGGSVQSASVRWCGR